MLMMSKECKHPTRGEIVALAIGIVIGMTAMAACLVIKIIWR